MSNRLINTRGRQSQKGILEYLTFLRKPKQIYDKSGQLASDICKKKKVSYRWSTTLEIKSYLFGLIRMVKVEYNY